VRKYYANPKNFAEALKVLRKHQYVAFQQITYLKTLLVLQCLIHFYSALNGPIRPCDFSMKETAMRLNKLIAYGFAYFARLSPTLQTPLRRSIKKHPLRALRNSLPQERYRKKKKHF